MMANSDLVQDIGEILSHFFQFMQIWSFPPVSFSSIHQQVSNKSLSLPHGTKSYCYTTSFILAHIFAVSQWAQKSIYSIDLHTHIQNKDFVYFHIAREIYFWTEVTVSPSFKGIVTSFFPNFLSLLTIFNT